MNNEPEYDEPTDPDPATIGNLETYPEPTGDDVADGTAIPDSDDLPEESTDGHPDGDV